MNATVTTARYAFITLPERLESNPAQEQLAKPPLALWEIGSHWFMPLRVGTFDFLAQAVGLRFRISIQEEASKGPGEDRGSSGEPCVCTHPETAVLRPDRNCCVIHRPAVNRI